MDRYAPHPHPLGKVSIFGDADHGLWSQATGQITTAGAVEIPIVGAAPTETTAPFEQHIGDSWVVHVPGTPPIVRTPEQLAADLAAGRTWLDYGIVSGALHRLYGKGLGRRAWVYAAPDGSRWHVQLTPTQVTFTRFGHFAADQDGVGEPIAAVPISITVPADGGGLVGFYEVDDVRSDGSQAAISVGVWAIPYDVVPASRGHYLRYINTIFKLQITGVPPAVSVSLQTFKAGQIGDTSESFDYTSYGWLQYEGDDNGQPFWVIQEWTDPPAPVPEGTVLVGEYYNPVGTGTATKRFALGGVFVGDEMRVVWYETTAADTRAYTYDPADLALLLTGNTQLPFAGTFSAVTTVRLYVGDDPLECVASDTGTVSGTLYYDATGTFSFASDGQMALDGQTVNTYSNANPATYVQNAVESPVGHYGLYPMRLGNRAWSLSAINLGAQLGYENAGGNHRQIGVAGVGAPLVIGRTVDLASTPMQIHGYASGHPVTGEIAWHPTSACVWV